MKLAELKKFYENMDIPTIITDHKYNRMFCNKAAIGGYLADTFDPFSAVNATSGADILLEDNKPALLLRFEASSNAIAVNAIPVGDSIVFQLTNAPSVEPALKDVFEDITDSLDGIFTLLPVLVKYGSGDHLTMESFDRIHRSCFSILRTVQNTETLIDLVSNCNLTSKTFDVAIFLKEIAEACNETCFSLPEQVPVVFVGDANGLFLTCDKDKFLITVLNIIINGMIYTKDENVIKIGCKSIGKNIVITFVDEGVGIPNEQLRWMSNRSGSVSTSPCSGQNTAGTGFALVCEFARRYSGLLQIESEEFLGSTVILSLPSASSTDEHSMMQGSREYANLVRDRFSPLYTQLSPICTLKWGENLFKST